VHCAVLAGAVLVGVFATGSTHRYGLLWAVVAVIIQQGVPVLEAVEVRLHQHGQHVICVM
jgi:hypothetical protein